MIRRVDYRVLGAALLLVGCPSEEGSKASGTDTDTGTGTTASSASASETMTTAPSTTSPSTTDPTNPTDPSTTAPTTTDPTSATETGSTTGEPACPYDQVDGTPSVDLQLVASGFNRPVLVVGHPTEPDRLFVVEQGGDVRILEPGETTAPEDVFLHVETPSAGNGSIGDERGLLGFDFHPDFPQDPRVYVAYNPGAQGSPPTQVDEFTVGGNGTATFSRTIIAADQPAGNHNGGMIQFGSDGYLYLSLGDGGGANNEYDTARNTGQILAKILRIGVEPDGSDDMPESCDDCGAVGPFDYTIPADNPFVNDPAFAPEIYAWGMRNPWRFSVDPDTGWLYVADVGQGGWEEVTVVQAGTDHGWHSMEGNHCFAAGGCDESAAPGQTNADGMVVPIAEYSHGGGRCSITGFGIYRSCEVPGWDGVYFYGDYCSGQVWAVHYDGNTATDLGEVGDFSGELPIGGGHNAYGDVFVTTAVAAAPGLAFTDGRIYRIAPAR